MIQYLLWGFTFFTLWLTLVWIFLLFEKRPSLKIKKLPNVTIAIPCHNEEQELPRTIRSIAKLKWPKEKLKVVVVDDGSSDKTFEVARKQLNLLKLKGLVLKQENKGKAEALNKALSSCNTPLFACLDADTCPAPKSLLYLASHFKENDRTAAVISVVMPKATRTFWQKFQAVEYTLANLLRWLMSNLGTLGITHGALCVFSTKILNELGGFKSDAGLTEDLEIALRLKKNGYDVKLEPSSKVLTRVPASFSELWKQRMRWYRGYFYNHWNYKSMFFNKRYSLFGVFQLPANFFMIALLILTVALVSFGTLRDVWRFLLRVLTIKGYLLNHFLEFPKTPTQFFLSQNVQIYLPIAIAGFLGFVLLVAGYRHLKTSALKQSRNIITYVVIAPYLATTHWLAAFAQEIVKKKRKWQ